MILFFFFNDTATTEIYTLSLHDALPICGRACLIVAKALIQISTARTRRQAERVQHQPRRLIQGVIGAMAEHQDRKSTRLNSSHANISYAVFCLKKKKNNYMTMTHITTIS